jgi:hypothetical protein
MADLTPARANDDPALQASLVFDVVLDDEIG